MFKPTVLRGHNTNQEPMKAIMSTRCGFWDKREDLREKLAASVALPSPVLALLLAACGGGGGGAGGGGLNLDGGTVPVSGWAYDGPVSNARVYVDANNNKILDAGDRLIGRTNTDGFYSGDIPTEHQGKLLFVNLAGAMDQGDPDVIGDERSTQGVWSAHAGSRVISPLTELMVETGLDSTEMASRLGLPETIDITQYNPFNNSSNRTKDDILVIAAGVATAERIKEDDVDHEAVLSAVGSSVRVLDAAYIAVAQSTPDNAEERFNALRDALENAYGNSIMDDQDNDITDDVTLGILNGLSAEIALRAGAEASLPNSPVAIGEVSDTTTKLATITVTKAPILGLGLEFEITGAGSDLFEARQDETGDNWGIYLRQGQELDYETAQVFTYTLGITLHIVNGTTRVGTPQQLGDLTLTVSNEDEPPTAMSLSSTSLTIAEGRTTARKLADITFTDDGLGTNAATIPNSDLFEVIGNELYLKGGVELDYETATEHRVTLTATTNPALTRTFTLTVSNEDDPPTAMTLSSESLTIPEGTTSRQKLADITFTDDGLGTNTASVSNTTLFEVIGNELYLKGGVNLDYETATEHQVTLTATTNPALTRTFTLTVSNEDDPPTAMTLSSESLTIPEGTTSRQKLADITFTDDGLGTNTASVSNDTLFEVIGNELYLKGGVNLDYETATEHQVTLTATTNPALTRTFTLTVSNEDDPPTARFHLPHHPRRDNLTPEACRHHLHRSSESLTIPEGTTSRQKLADSSPSPMTRLRH